MKMITILMHLNQMNYKNQIIISMAHSLKFNTIKKTSKINKMNKKTYKDHITSQIMDTIKEIKTTYKNLNFSHIKAKLV